MPRLLCPELALDDDQQYAFAGHLDAQPGSPPDDDQPAQPRSC
jgi:hypothetical protein